MDGNKRARELTKKAPPTRATVMIKLEAPAVWGTAALFLKGLMFESGLLLSVVVLGEEGFVTAAMLLRLALVLPLPLPFPFPFPLLVGRVVVVA